MGSSPLPGLGTDPSFVLATAQTMQATLRLQQRAVSASTRPHSRRFASRREQQATFRTILTASLCMQPVALSLPHHRPKPQCQFGSGARPQLPAVLPLTPTHTGLVVPVRAHSQHYADGDEEVLPIWSGRFDAPDPEKLKFHSPKLGGKTLGEELGECRLLLARRQAAESGAALEQHQNPRPRCACAGR